MVEKNIKARDRLQQYCHLLGHKVPFKYCRSVNSTLPCRSILDCWQSAFPVGDFVRIHYLEEEIKSFLQPAKPKILQIFDAILKASETGQK